MFIYNLSFNLSLIWVAVILLLYPYIALYLILSFILFTEIFLIEFLNLFFGKISHKYRIFIALCYSLGANVNFGLVAIVAKRNFLISVAFGIV